jgi:hypothetical protein
MLPPKSDITVCCAHPGARRPFRRPLDIASDGLGFVPARSIMDRNMTSALPERAGN